MIQEKIELASLKIRSAYNIFFFKNLDIACLQLIIIFPSELYLPYPNIMKNKTLQEEQKSTPTKFDITLKNTGLLFLWELTIFLKQSLRICCVLTNAVLF